MRKRNLSEVIKAMARDLKLPVSAKQVYRVDVLCESRGSRAEGETEYTRESAEATAEWFGTSGDLRAVVVGPLDCITVQCDPMPKGGA